MTNNYASKGQQIGSYLFIGILVLLGVKYVAALADRERAYDDLFKIANDSFQNAPPEQFLAHKDGAESSSIPTYGVLLDRLDQRCIENRNEVTALVFALNGANRKAGFEESYLQTLEMYTGAAETYLRPGDSCIEVYQSLKPES